MFISNAYADTPGGFDSIIQNQNVLMIALMLAAMYFIVFRPQMKRQKELKAMMDALTKGDEVVTAGGVLGKIVKVADAYITLEIATGVEVVIQRSAVTLLLPKGTIKSQQ